MSLAMRLGPLAIVLLILCFGAATGQAENVSSEVDAMIGVDNQGQLYFRSQDKTVTLNRIMELINGQAQTLTDLQGVILNQATFISDLQDRVNVLQDRVTVLEGHDQPPADTNTNGTTTTAAAATTPPLITTTTTTKPSTNSSIPDNNGTLVWAKLLGGLTNDIGYGIATDSANSVCIVGSTLNSLDTPNLGGNDIVVAKYANDGVLLWVRQLGSSGNENGRGIATDAAGNVYITGDTNSASLGGSNVRAGAIDIVVAKYASDGTRLWVRLLGGSGNDYGYGIATDDAGNVFITGFTASTFLNGSSSTNAGGGTGTDDIVVAKLSASNGTLIWAQLLGGPGDDQGLAIATDRANNVVITGYTTNSLGGNVLVAGNDIVVAQYTSNGTLRWIRMLGGSGSDIGNGIATDSNGNVCIAGETNSPSLGSTNTNAGNYNMMIAQYASDGTDGWAQILGGGLADYGHGVATDSENHVYMTGFAYSTSVGGSNINVGTNGGSDVVVVKYAQNGTRLWARMVGGSSNDEGYGIATDASGNIFIVGQINSFFLGGSNQVAGGYDILVAKLS